MARKGFVLSVSGMTPKVMDQVTSAIEDLLEDIACNGLQFNYHMVYDVRDGSEIAISPPRKR